MGCAELLQLLSVPCSEVDAPRAQFGVSHFLLLTFSSLPLARSAQGLSIPHPEFPPPERPGWNLAVPKDTAHQFWCLMETSRLSPHTAPVAPITDLPQGCSQSLLSTSFIPSYPGPALSACTPQLCCKICTRASPLQCLTQG